MGEPPTPKEIENAVYAAARRCQRRGVGDDMVMIVFAVKEIAEAVDALMAPLRHALSTRPDYNFRCDGCGAPHTLDTSIPSDVWNRIAPEAGALCTLCIDDRVAALGLTDVDVEFYFVGKAIRSRLYADSMGDVAARKRAAEANTGE